MNGPEVPKRRRFITWLLGGGLAGFWASVVYPVIRFLSPPDVPEAATNQVEAGRTDDPELQQRGFKIVRFGAEPVILIRIADQEYRAFSATCTHLDCIVEYAKGERRIVCNCHNGVYDLSGRNIAGPPPRPLTPFAVNLVAGPGPGVQTIVVSRS
ncbi:MAG: Rieske (2Fe-2S) protein [Acidobacteriota bacterium]